MKFAEQNLKLAEGDEEKMAEALYSFAMVLCTEYDGSGRLADLDDAIAKLEEAELLCHPEVDFRTAILENLSDALHTKYDITGDMECLERSIARLREIVKRIPDDYPDPLSPYARLGGCLSSKYRRTGHEESLIEAVALCKRVVEETPPQHQKYDTYLGVLSTALAEMYQLKGDSCYLNDAIAYLNTAVETMENSSIRDVTRSNLGDKLLDRYVATGNIDDLNSGIENMRACESSLSPQNPGRASALQILGRQLGLRAVTHRDFDQTLRDLSEAKTYLRESVESPSGKPLNRVYSARLFMEVPYIEQDRENANDVATIALDLLPYVCGRHLQREDQEYAVSQIQGLAADACSISILLNRPEDALQRAEYGRGLVLGNLIDRRDDVVEVRRQCPSLADEYESLRNRAFQIIDFSGSKDWEQQAHDRRQAFEQLATCEESIRKLHGLEDFLRPASTERLQQCARDGPIVIVNVTHICSGAVIVTESRLEIVHLRDMESDMQQFVKELLEKYRATAVSRVGAQRDMKPIPRASPSIQMLGWLWRCCVHPVLSRLSDMELISASGESRVWWIGSGVASSLPFHAAGEFSPDFLNVRNPGLPSSCLDWIVPSYTPTIKALEHSRAHANALKLPDKLSVLAVSMLQTPGQIDLPGVGKEIEAVKAINGQNCQMSNLTLLEQPTAQQVLDGILRSHIVHFACHGSSDAVNPSGSHIILQKLDNSGRAVEDKLTVASLLDSIAKERGWIVYLSACSTAQIRATEFADEGIHLASAFQVAGFANAIGSLWSADDQTCVDVARYFYKALFEGISQSQTVKPAIALRSAIINVRFKGRELQPPDLWAPFIHYGV
ncbi:uncharacterized protein LTHEOB_3027 [Lasiodiplodia theobromae]|uniref:uncharacterized protein n=1 Tax=Lasiodiplodia theobromae TaxID=45133 RepID=UPI0015C3D395|nr:uncharacterized protein LTHEOB_3027 [Lasiodiplodia theobromae]KAF4535052.1 hypothetical protein LTHEOB_3027 [Lasiodiplodia theobromae]